MAIVSWCWFRAAWLLIFALACCLLFIQWKKCKHSRSMKSFRSFPGLPIVGNIHLILGNMRTRLRKWFHLMQKLEQPTLFWFFCVPIVCLGRSKHMLQTINKNQDRELFGIFKDFVGDGILLARGEQWRYIRRFMNQAFTLPMLKQYIRVFNEQSIIMVDRMRENANSGIHFDFHTYAADMNLDVAVENMMDYKLKTQEIGNNEFSDALIRVNTVESKRLNNPIILFDIFFKIYLYLSGYKKFYTIVHELPKKIAKEKICAFNRKKIEGLAANTLLHENSSKTLIDILLNIHDENPEFTEHQMSVEILNMIFTGSDTTATTVSFICLLLAMYPEIQEKVYQEILHVCKDGSAEVTMEHCNHLKYMEQCIKETLRRFTLVPLTFRRCSESTKLDDGRIIPANCLVGFMYHSVHHDPSVYPDPEKFDPDRFSPTNAAQNGQNFVGFGVGHRSCIGMKYAMLSLKVQLVHVLRKYRLTTDWRICDIVLVSNMASRSENGYLIRIWKRESGEI